jgi:hypothetical protein
MNRIGFKVAKYDVSRPLYIDPLIYSTYLDGSSSSSSGNGIVVDSAGNAYVTGSTGSGFPTTPGAFETACANYCIFITKLNTTGAALVYSTYIGGSEGDYGSAIAVDGDGNAYITGETYSSDFPTTPGAFQTTYGGNIDAFVTKINSSGSALVYSTYLGGSNYDFGAGIAADSAGTAYVTGTTCSADVPTVNPLQPDYRGPGNCLELDYLGNAFVAEFNPTGSAIYSTFLGGSGGEYFGDGGFSIAADITGSAYVTGLTESTNFPVTPAALQTVYGGGYYPRSSSQSRQRTNNSSKCVPNSA